MGQYSSRSHQRLHWDVQREVREQPRQRLSSRGASHASWKRSEDNSGRKQQASLSCSPGSEDKGAATHGAAAGEANTQERWTQQLEVWAIDEMMAATEAELSEAGAVQERQPEAQDEPVRAPEQCPLAMAGGVCMVGECEWCKQEQAQGQAGANKPDIAGVGKRPVSEQHMPNLVSETGERGDGEEAEKQSGTEKGFDLSKVGEKLAAVRAVEAEWAQQNSDSRFDLQRARRKLEKLRAAKAHI